jgi:ATP-binding cassette, subfamily C, bacterial
VKQKLVLQHSEEDCGAACLAAIAKFYGRLLKINSIREAVGTGSQGTTLLGLRRGAEALGFNARSVRASPEILWKLQQLPLPAIIHWKGNHWVVLYGKQGKKYTIADPAIGMRYLSRMELLEGWTDWILLLLEPDPVRFYAQVGEQDNRFEQWIQRLWVYRAILAEAVGCAIAVGLLSLATPFLLQILTDDVLIRGDLQLLTSVVLAVIALSFVRRGLALVQSNLIAHFAQRIELGLILEFGRQILRLPLLYYESRRSGEIVSRLRDIQEINLLLSRAIISLPGELFVAIVSFIFMLMYSQKLTVFAVFLAGAMTLSTILFLPSLQQKTRKLLVTEAENQGILVETFKGALTLKTTAAAPQFWEEYQSRFGQLANLAFGTMQIGIVNNTFSGLVADVGGVALLWFGSTLVIGKELSLGQLLAFTTLNRNVATFIISSLDFVDEFARIETANSRLQEVITHPPEIKDEKQKPWVDISDTADIACSKIEFHYPGRTDVVQDFSLTIPGGQVVALIGKSGCGKSTVAKLIAGLYTPQSGNIRIGRYNIQDISLDCLRQQAILVPQEPHFWSRSIIENFRLGMPHVRFDQIVRACEIAQADEFIAKLSDKYQTVLGEFGASLSGGQRQRLAIARAIVNNPPILILDESTAGLDPASESQVLNQLLHHRRGKTTILISHRPRVINLADWVIFLRQGRMYAQGTIAELQAHPGEHIEFLHP